MNDNLRDGKITCGKDYVDYELLFKEVTGKISEFYYKETAKEILSQIEKSVGFDLFAIPDEINRDNEFWRNLFWSTFFYFGYVDRKNKEDDEELALYGKRTYSTYDKNISFDYNGLRNNT